MRLQNIRFPEEISAGKKNCISIEMENGSISMDISTFLYRKKKEVHKPGKFDAAPGIEWLSGNSSDVG
mgnify:CR=1 FL=1